jgi:NDP-sugar pyrophosphorylase family protein
MKAMILAAGVGSRLGNLTQDQPKPMLDVNGHPILAYILSNLVQHGFDQIVINLHYRPEAIQHYFGDGSRWGARITYLQEAHLLGTAGGVKNAATLLQGTDPFLVHYGDVLTNQDYRAMLGFHFRKGSKVTLLLHQRAHSNSIVCLDSENRVTTLLERPSEAERGQVESNWVNSGVYMFHSSVLDMIPSGTACDFPRDVFPSLIARGKVFGFPLQGYRCAIDSPQRLESARESLRSMAWPGLQDR